MSPPCSQESAGRPGLCPGSQGDCRRLMDAAGSEGAARALETEQELSRVGASQRALSFKRPGKGPPGGAAPHHTVPHRRRGGPLWGERGTRSTPTRSTQPAPTWGAPSLGRPCLPLQECSTPEPRSLSFPWGQQDTGPPGRARTADRHARSASWPEQAQARLAPPSLP